jgi:hypothetical protein
VDWNYVCGFCHVRRRASSRAQTGRAVADENGGATNFVLVSIPDLFQNAVKAAVAEWKFPKSSAGQQIQAAIEFHLNCPQNKH